MSASTTYMPGLPKRASRPPLTRRDEVDRSDYAEVRIVIDIVTMATATGQDSRGEIIENYAMDSRSIRIRSDTSFDRLKLETYNLVTADLRQTLCERYQVEKAAAAGEISWTFAVQHVGPRPPIAFDKRSWPRVKAHLLATADDIPSPELRAFVFRKVKAEEGGQLQRPKPRRLPSQCQHHILLEGQTLVPLPNAIKSYSISTNMQVQAGPSSTLHSQSQSDRSITIPVQLEIRSIGKPSPGYHPLGKILQTHITNSFEAQINAQTSLGDLKAEAECFLGDYVRRMCVQQEQEIDIEQEAHASWSFRIQLDTGGKTTSLGKNSWRKARSEILERRGEGIKFRFFVNQTSKKKVQLSQLWGRKAKKKPMPIFNVRASEVQSATFENQAEYNHVDDWGYHGRRER